MIGEEPYRYLEAIQNRREYIEDQLASARPVFACAGKPGILLSCIKVSTPKLFEIYDHIGIAGLGHPADIERVRQSAIDAAHLEGFSRSRADVSARRLVNYSLAPALKNAFEQIFSAPLLFGGIIVELTETTAEDDFWRVSYDGTFDADNEKTRASGALISGKTEVNRAWEELTDKPKAGDTLKAMAAHSAKAHLWAKRTAAAISNADEKPTWEDLPKSGNEARKTLEGELAFAFLDREQADGIAWRIPTTGELALGRK